MSLPRSNFWNVSCRADYPGLLTSKLIPQTDVWDVVVIYIYEYTVALYQVTYITQYVTTPIMYETLVKTIVSMGYLLT